MIAIGPERFRELLAGFHAMDEHFRTAPFERNLPVLHGPARASGTRTSSARRPSASCRTSQYLKRFPAYLQQLTMESNGKSVTLDGEPRRLRDRRRLLGRAGHERPARFYQLIHQGTKLIPCRLHRLRCSTLNPLGDHHDLLMANVFAQAEALAFGKTAGEVRAEGTPEPSSRTASSRATARRTSILAERADPVDARRARRALRAQRVHAGRRSGGSTRSTSGASSSARRSPSGSSRSSEPRRAGARPRLLDERADPPLSGAQVIRLVLSDVDGTLVDKRRS